MRARQRRLSDALENARRAHAGADAHGHHAVLQVAAAQGVDHRGRADRAGGAERVAQRDRAAHRVDLGRIEAEVLDHRQRLRGEGFVQFEPVDLVLGDAGAPCRPRESLLSGRCP